MLVIVLLMSLPTTIQTILSDLKSTSYTTVSPSLVKEIRTLSEIPPEKTLLLSSALQQNSLIPAIANRGVYFADPSVLSILGHAQSERQSYVQSVELGERPCKSNEVFVSFANIGHLQVEECPRKIVFGPINPRSLQ